MIIVNNKYVDNPNYDNSHDKRISVNGKWIDNPNYTLYTLFTPSQKSILRYGVVDEVEYFSKQEYVSYIIYAFILLALVTLLITIVIISKKYNIPIDYKFSIINTIIVTILIGGYAFVVMWYSVFNPYTLNIQKLIFENVMEFYKSA